MPRWLQQTDLPIIELVYDKCNEGRMSNRDIVERLKSASESDGDLPVEEVRSLLIEAAEAIEFLRSLLGPVEEVGLEDLPPRGRA